MNESAMYFLINLRAQWSRGMIPALSAGYEIENSKTIFLFSFLPNSVQFPIFAVDCGLSFLSYI